MVKTLHVAVVLETIGKDHNAEKPHKHNQCVKVLHFLVEFHAQGPGKKMVEVIQGKGQPENS